ncbi:hypothetical protein DEM26_18125 [Thioclava sp. NG1]|uniref:hypothetical protein n=1 Tax=Thioclava sp. NG1 TaxID=2182426 RepID=UPI000D60FD8A|nr:hypothetical protein [Thioclava sp. NG1]PWE48466.1 hypothetical protein DEM26_18125 [Thioclava sp. NG1]
MSEDENTWAALLITLLNLAGPRDKAAPAIADALSEALRRDDLSGDPETVSGLLGDVRRIMIESGYTDRLNKFPNLSVLEGGRK